MSDNIINPDNHENKKKFEVKVRSDGSGGLEKAVFIDNELLDWQIDLNSYVDAMKMGPQYRRAVQRSIEEHFTEAVSETLGRKVTMEEIKKAIITGWI